MQRTVSLRSVSGFSYSGVEDFSPAEEGIFTRGWGGVSAPPPLEGFTVELKNSFKIIAVDNWNRELIADYLVADNVLSEREGKVMVDALNEYNWGLVYYRLVPDTYELYEFKG